MRKNFQSHDSSVCSKTPLLKAFRRFKQIQKIAEKVMPALKVVALVFQIIVNCNTLASTPSHKTNPANTDSESKIEIIDSQQEK